MANRRIACIIILLVGIVFTSACAQLKVLALETSNLPYCAKPRPDIDLAYIVFFGQHSDQLTDRAKAILNEFSISWVKDRVYNLEIYGHIDTSELQPGDHGLGKRRAAAVRAFLQRAGVPDRVIVEYDLAATQPLVRTKANTPEPQNRHVNFVSEVRGSIEKDINKEECFYWLRTNFCETQSNRHDKDACRNALNYLR